ncbi:MAG: NYN domain-containing protein, partial [Alphaproteobacteria bacterium]|nr:NYN domain-containing protein [Alphaproteobacteria bacterium]
MKTNPYSVNAYIDGLNLYYGCLRGSPYKWLDVMRLIQSLVGPRHHINRIKYFTAIVKAKDGSPLAPHRQAEYIRALKHQNPRLEVFYGKFQRDEVNLVSVRSPSEKHRVFRDKEKRTDVNMATHLLNDAWLDAYDGAVIVSNDSDFSEAMRLVKIHFPRKDLWLVTPDETEQPANELIDLADFHRRIHPRVLEYAQLPDKIPGTSIHLSLIHI